MHITCFAIMLRSTISVFFLTFFYTISLAQVKNSASSTTSRSSWSEPEINEWWWGYTAREVRNRLMDQGTWGRAIPTDKTCTTCTAYKNSSYVTMEFKFGVEGLYYRSWKMPNDSPDAKKWADEISKMEVSSVDGREKETWFKWARTGHYGAHYSREFCGDYVIYTALIMEKGHINTGFSIIRSDLKDCSE